MATWRVIAGLALIAAPAAAQQAPAACGDEVPAAARRIDWQQPTDVVAALTGTWDLVLVSARRHADPTIHRTVRIRLTLPDSAARASVLGLRLVGTVLSPSPLGGGSAAFAPERPTAGIAGRTLYLSNMGVLDAGGDFLTPTHVDANGFWGTWEYSDGIAILVTQDSTGAWVPVPQEEVRGVFCARRVES